MIEYLLFFLGFFFLLVGAHYLIEGASALAKRMGWPPIIVGLTVLAFGTTMPEFFVTVFAAIQGSTELVLGNIVGSNIANILLVLGIAAILYPLTVEKRTIWKEVPFALLAAIVLFVVSNDRIIDNSGVVYSALTRVDGIIMLLFFFIFLAYVLQLALGQQKKVYKKELKPKMKYYKFTVIALMIVAGILGLFFGANWIVTGALAITSKLGLSEFLISATIIAIGTSLPEIVTIVTAALKHKSDLAIGNIIGANVFNVFYVLAITAIISPIRLPPLINIDMIFLIFVSFLLFAYLFIGHKRQLVRWQGIAFLILYVLYLISVFIRG